MSLIRQPGATAATTSAMPVLGSFGTKTSPPCIRSIESRTNRTPWSSVIQKRVIAGWVTVTWPFCLCFRNSGMTLPRLPTTFP